MFNGTIRNLVYRNRWASRRYFQYKKLKSFSANSLDLKIEKYLGKKSGFYVEIGANDGLKQSNTKILEMNSRWRGVLIEPAPEVFSNLVKNRTRDNFFFNCACVSFSFVGNTIDLIYADLMTTAIGLESDLKSLEDHILSSEKYLKLGQVHKFQAEARTLNSILEEVNAPEIIEFFSLDVEGAELEILKGIDHYKYRFQYMLVECRNIEKLVDYLAPFGYKIKDKLSHHDYLFALDS